MDEKRMKLLLRLDEFLHSVFYSNFAKNYASYSFNFKDEFISYSDLRKLSYTELLKCYLKIGSTDFYVLKFLDKIVSYLEDKYNLDINNIPNE